MLVYVRGCDMKVMIDIDEKQFGKNISRETGQVIAQDIIDRYCNVEYYNQEELEEIANGGFEGYSH